jgi:antitoxin (DNA-binding transcriptional repressor) of toxin-antitoxin stability system
MFANHIVSITDLRQNATSIIKNLKKGIKFVMVHGKPKAALIPMDQYEKIAPLIENPMLSESMIQLAHNPSLNFLHDEPDLYDNE